MEELKIAHYSAVRCHGQDDEENDTYLLKKRAANSFPSCRAKLRPIQLLPPVLNGVNPF